jgi:succinate-acetate transporter protein
LWIAFYLLGLGAIAGAHWLTRLGGWVGILCGAIAMYTSFAEVTNFCFGHEVLPTGHPVSATPTYGQPKMAE